MRPLTRTLILQLSQLAADLRAVAAVEFAIILPLMLLLYLGSFDVARQVMVGLKESASAASVVELVAEQSTATAMTQAQVSAIVTSSAATMSPYSSTPLTTTVTAVDILQRSNGTCCDAKVRWSYTQGGTLRPCNVILTQVSASAAPSPTTIPASVMAAESGLLTGTKTSGAIIVSDLSYIYTPLSPSIDKLLAGPMARTAYAIPRQTGQVTLASPLATVAGQSGVVCS